MAGVGTNNLPVASFVADILGNDAGGNTRRIAIDRLVALITALMGPTYALRSQLFADLAWPAGSIGYVRADGTSAFNGVYKKSGNSGGGSWSRIGDLPTSAVEAAIISDLTTELRSRRIASTANANFGSTTFPPGTTTVIYRASGVFSISQRVDGAVPSPVTAIHQQDAEGNWWERVWLSTDLRNALRNAGVFSLVNVGGTANAITASLSDAAIAAGMQVDTSSVIEITPIAANTAAATLTIPGDATRNLQNELGNALSAGFLRAGVSMMFRRAGPNWRALSSATSDQITGLRNEMATADALEASARADADGFQRAAIRQGAITMTNVVLTGNAYTADIEAAFAAVAMTDIPANGEVTISFPATNPSQNPTVNGRGLRRRNGSAWPAGKIIAGSPYTLKRIGNEMRVLSGDVQGEELEAAISSLSRKLITITSASSGGERNTQNWTQTPGSYVGEAVTALNFAPAGLAAPYTFEVQVEQSASGIWQTWRDVSGRVFNQRRINGVWTGWAEMARQDGVNTLSTALQGKAEQSDMAAAGLLLGMLSGDFQSLLQRVYVTVTQLTPDMPVRPNYPRVEWVVYTPPPREIMGNDDRYFLMETPQPPNMPENEIRVLNTRYGNQAVIRVRAVPVLRPPVSGIEYSVDGGGFLPLSGITPGDYFVTIPNGSREVQLRYRNTFNDVSVETLPIPVVISQNSIVPVLTGTGRLHDFDSVNWSSLSVDQNPASRGLILDGTGNVRASHINARLRYGHTGFFVTDQRVRAADVRVHPSAANSFGAIFGVNNNEAGTAAIEVIITATGANIYRRTAATGAGTLLASFTEAWEFPLTSVDVRRAGNDIQLRVGGLLVWTYTLPETHRLLGGTPSIGIMYPNISGADLSLTRFRPDLLGHV